MTAAKAAAAATAANCEDTSPRGRGGGHFQRTTGGSSLKSIAPPGRPRGPRPAAPEGGERGKEHALSLSAPRSCRLNTIVLLQV